MGTYNLPRNVKGEGRILFIFSTKSLITTCVGGAVGLIFYFIFKIFNLTMVGIVISITMVSVLGIKYMIGSVEEKAEYKKTMIPMIIGAILLFTTSTIVSIIYQLTSQL